MRYTMRGRLLLLFVLCALLFWLQTTTPYGAIPALAASDTLVWVDLQSMTLTLYQDEKAVATWPVAGGKGTTPTPVGVFRVVRRFTRQPGVMGTRFLGLDVPWGVYGIHGTNAPGSIGSRASCGCIRMYNRDVEALYRLVPVGTRVVIEDGPYQSIGWTLKTLKPGDVGSQVLMAQKRLYALGYYDSGFDGKYGPGMSDAIKRLKVDHALPALDVVDAATWDAMGILLFE
ncbi:MAG: L,D-transpeptidase family protein [Oscillospiraceae bacterium]|nr:L,D-transpeptidase family protein [Oscillospiraceae bacterium]